MRALYSHANFIISFLYAQVCRDQSNGLFTVTVPFLHCMYFKQFGITIVFVDVRRSASFIVIRNAL